VLLIEIMASVTSLGLHQPTAVPYLIQEHLLPADPPPSAYTWQNISSDDGDSSGGDELLITKTCVVWSRGGIVRKSFRFEVEDEPVTRAVLTSFTGEKHKRYHDPEHGKIAARFGASDQTAHGDRPGGKVDASDRKSKALVIFLKTQAHVYFLSGTSHVLHLPFEVEYASAAPDGLIIQRKLQTDKTAPSSLKFPRVPPNSFISSQVQPWSAKSSQQSTFSIASLGSPKQLPLPTTALLGDLWHTPAAKDDSSWPRLFSLTDPLAEMGLLVAASKPDGNRRVSLKVSALDPAEEIIHITNLHEFTAFQGSTQDPLIVAVTLNRETSMYTVWRLAYVEQDDAMHDKPAATSGTMSRRRSSFAPGTATGATTPISSQYAFRESMGGTGLGVNKSRREENIVEDKMDFAKSLDLDFESTGAPRRKSRRVSSMLARADLSATHERTAFSELAGHQHNTNRRGESLGSQRARNSMGHHASMNGHAYLPESQLGNSISSFLEAPVDELLEELRSGGDFEGFNTMGLDDNDFDGLRKEIVMSKIESVPAEHSTVRFSSQHKPAQSQCRAFTLAAPPCAAEDPQKSQVVVCILDSIEKRLLVLPLNIRIHRKADDQGYHSGAKKGANSPKEVIVVTFGEVMQAKGVLDACKLTDGSISRILILTETPNGFGELTLQAPWSKLMKVAFPEKLTISNIRSLDHDATPRKKREGGFKRILSQGPRALRSLQHSLPGGIVDLVDDEGRFHRLRIRMEPRNPLVKQVINVCRTTLPGARGGEDILVGWWNVKQWLGHELTNDFELDWTAMAVVLFALILGSEKAPKASIPERKRKSRSFLRSSSGAQNDVESWQDMLSQETIWGGPQPPWMMNSGWTWLVDKEGIELETSRKDVNFILKDPGEVGDREKPLRYHVKLAREFINSSLGQAALGSSGYMPTAGSRSLESRSKAFADIMAGLHLLREEQKLDVTSADSLDTGVASLTPILAQMCRWLGWAKWVAAYDVEDASISGVAFESTKIVDIPQPFDPPAIYDWIEGCLTRNAAPFLTLGDIIASRSGAGIAGSHWASLTPRTFFFMRYFAAIRPNSSSAEMVEALHASGVTSQILDTLPEAIMVPLREAIVDCQAQPPVSWDKDLLNLVDREDVNMFLLPRNQRRSTQSPLLPPTHEASTDIHTVCSANAEPESVGSFDGSAEVNRQSITRLIFKDDRRFNEAAKILNTSKPTVARCEAEPEWSESDLLEAQKEHVQMLAIRTLAIPTGRGLLYFSARIPLLTEKFPIGGFNLHCVMKPTNNTVGVDKNAFTEEKVCWAFFHAGVSAGLSISRDAKGIDTSWILYNRPQELSNRHAGFLLALGLNGHLKSVAKWVAFKYLTPKHTMTSIGLLLGLAASYLGTMDSLITRLLSVHVTRMLPPGAAELNLSPLTQTTGIVGIGLLYCNTQHRRMSEIMLSEIEHTDPENEDEPLRNESYRLAAGFALGLINLGKGSDLKGLHDMHLTERLLTLAVGSKKVTIVHVLDKATAAAVVAIALIFMKSEDQALARKVDVPDSPLQYDYVRPDIFLLRTLARHLIMWSKIEASPAWITKSLPNVYRDRSRLINVEQLSSDDLPFYDIVTGLCFSIALRHAGSGLPHVRDLLLHYLDQMIRICYLPALNYDQKLTRNTIRNCQDLLALSAATVMAGTGDLAVFRRLRALHGRDDSETPYGSHLAAHLAIGALFLGGGTYTFGTSNLAIAALIVAFYPIFPTSILDNKSHLQAFRHFWVLATEARCLVARDIDTNRPVSVPISIFYRGGRKSSGYAPCLLPDLHQVCSVSTDTREYWNVVLDFDKNPKHLEAFKSSQTIFVRRRPAYDASTAVFHATLQALDDTDGAIRQPLEWLFELPVFKMLTTAEKALVLPPDSNGGNIINAATEGTLVDTRLLLEKATLLSGKRDRLQGLKLLFEWASKMRDDGREMQWIRREVVERLKAQVWMMAMENR
jgi:anaphase-promoting complex subunit 1